jgi:UDP-glucuronate 4-epimerase
MKILVTGAAGFIGFHLVKALLNKCHTVVGLDNINDYYDVNLKYARLKELGVARDQAEPFLNKSTGVKYNDSFQFVRMNLEDRENLPLLFKEQNFDVVCNLAAQAGVRYSLENPHAYVQSNVVGFVNILECCRHNDIKHLVYASSSSVYGANAKIPFSEQDRVDHPVSLYAATKKSNELMAYTYSHLYSIPTTGLRFFTVYGPWGRPDMSPILFADAISSGRPINIFNNGIMERDFTFVEDIVEGIVRVSEKAPINEGLDVPYLIHNIGNSNPIKLMDFIYVMEKYLGIVAKKNFMEMQPGDLKRTWADTTEIERRVNYKPDTSIDEGISKFVYWFKEYYEK